MRSSNMVSVATKASSVLETALSFFNAYHAHDVEKMLAECSDDA
jgi:hypothetical protein